MRRLHCTIVTSVAFLSIGLVGSPVEACGGGGGGLSRGVSPGIAQIRPSQDFFASAFTPVPNIRQAAAAQAAAYNARMRPIRLARAAQVRAEKIAKLEARKQVYLAQREERRRQEQEFLAKARDWTDSSGDYQVQAIMINANDSLVRLQKKDGKTVDVPRSKLSVDDQLWVAANVPSSVRAAEIMLASAR